MKIGSNTGWGYNMVNVRSNIRRGIRGFLGTTSNPIISRDLAARIAVPSLRQGLPNHLTDFAALCRTLDGYRFNTVFEELGAAAFDLITADDIEDLRPRGIYNPVPAIIDFYAQHVLTGRMVSPPKDDVTMLEDPDAAMPDGDLWIKSINPDLDEAILAIWNWSNLQLTKTELAENCATYGNCLLVASEDPLLQQVQIEVLHPASLVDVDFDRTGQIITYARVETSESRRNLDGSRAHYTLTRIYTPNEFQTLEDNRLVSRTINPHGFVPVVLARHHAVTNDTWGLCAFASALPAIHELCIGASVLGSNILKHQKPRWVIFGSSAPAAGDVIESSDDMLFFPQGAKADTMIPKLDIQGTYVHLQTILDQLEEDFPELQLNKVGSGKRDVSGAGVRGLLSGLIRKGLGARERYEYSLKTILQMAVAMGQNLGGTGVNVFGKDLGAYNSKELEFEFHWPDIIPLNRLERLRIAAEEKTLELQIVIQEAQIQLARTKGPEVLLQFKAPQQLGGNTPPPGSSANNPAQGTPAQ